MIVLYVLRSFSTMELSYIFGLLFAICFVNIDGLMFHLNPNQKKCLKEEIHKDVLVTGDYELSDTPAQKTHLTVRLFSFHVRITQYKTVFESVRY